MRRLAFSPRLTLAGALLLAPIAARIDPAGSDPPAAPGAGAPPASRSVTYAARTMGTYVNVTLVTADSAAGAPRARAAHAIFGRIDSLMSNWTTTSEVARLNREAGQGATEVQPDVATVIDASVRMWKHTDGAFDITVEPLVRLWGFLGGPKRVPADDEVAAAFRHVGTQKLRFDPAARTLRFDEAGMRIDLGSIAKGYAVDLAAAALESAGTRDALIDLSGNMVALGAPAGATSWRIGIRDPRGRVPYFARLPLTGQAIATSGKYEQFVAANGRTYGHIMDPRTGRPADGLISVTVIAQTAMEADAWDTPLFVLGVAAAKRKAKAGEEIDVVLVEPGDGIDTVWVEETLRGRFALEPQARGFFHVEYF